MTDQTQYVIFRKIDFLINHWVLHLHVGTIKSYLNKISENDNDDQLLTEYFEYLSAEFRIGKQNTFEKTISVFEIFLRFIR